MTNSWDDYRIFIEVARTKSLFGASKKLKINHSTAFRRINSLEEKLKTRLFERLNNGYLLTPSGEQLLSDIGDLDEKIDNASRKILGQDVSLKGNIRLASSDTLGFLVLPQLIEKFKRSHPDIIVELIISPQIYDLSKREADIALRVTKSPPEHLFGRNLGSIEVAVTGAKSVINHEKSLNDLLKEENWVGGAEYLSNQKNILWINKRVRPEQISARANQMIAVAKLVQTGIGYGVIPVYLSKILEDLQVIYPLKELDTNLWILTHQDLKSNAKIRVLMDFLTKEIKQILEI